MKKLGLLLILALTALSTQAQKYTEMSTAMENAEKRIAQVEKKCQDDVAQLTSRLSMIRKYLKLEEIAGRLYYYGEKPYNWTPAMNVNRWEATLQLKA